MPSHLMMITSLRTPSFASFIITQIINGYLSIKDSWTVKQLSRHLQMYQSHDQQDDENLNLHSHQISEYIVTLSSGDPIYILAANSVNAAYSALELSEDRKAKLINVRRTDEW